MNEAHQELQAAFRAFEASEPSNGWLPQTDEEWEQVQRAVIIYTGAVFMLNGLKKSHARRLARHLYAGPAGLSDIKEHFEATRWAQVGMPPDGVH